LDEALEAGKKAVDLSGDDRVAKYEALSWLGVVLQEKRMFEKALACFEKTVEIRPDDPIPYSMAAFAAFYAGNYDKAIRLFDKELEMGGDEVKYAWIWRHIAKMKLGLDDKKFASFAESLEFDGEWPSPVISFYAGTMSKRRCMEMAADRDPKRDKEKKCEAYYYIGEMELAKGDREEAEKLFEKCLECGIRDFRETLASKIRVEELKRGNRKNGGK
jgi:lipoprotein NlpI